MSWLFQPENVRARQAAPCEEQKDSAPSRRGLPFPPMWTEVVTGPASGRGERMMENVDPSAGPWKDPLNATLRKSSGPMKL